MLGERLGSGDGERKTMLTRQIAFEPLPASVLFALVCSAEAHLASMIFCFLAPPIRHFMNLLTVQTASSAAATTSESVSLSPRIRIGFATCFSSF